MMQEQLDTEREEGTNPKLTALKAQLVDTQLSLRKLPTLFADQKKMIDDLSQYLKSKGSVEAIEQQDKQLQKLAVENGELKTNETRMTEQLNDLQK